MLETLVKVAVYATTAIVLNDLGNKLVDNVTGNTDVEETKVPRACVLVGSIVTGAAAAIAVTDIIFEEPETIIETVSEFM